LLEVGRILKLFGGVRRASGYSYDVSADGQRFIVAQPVGRGGAAVNTFRGGAAPPVTLVQNWTHLLKKK
jgi:hypothetical protein